MSQDVKISDEVARLLEQLDIRHAFGIIGAGNVHLFDSIARRGFTEIVCMHHEQAATMAMQTYYRRCGRLAAALLTTGGGATNGVTGVVSAWADSIPGLVIAGNEHSKHTRADNALRMWGVQGYDTVGMMRQVTKYASRVVDPALTLFELGKAAAIALEGRPGPTWVEIPMNIQSTRIDPAGLEKYLRAAPPRPRAAGGMVAGVVEALRRAERPLLWLGHGIRLAGAAGELPALLDALGVPALISWAGIDMVDSAHPLIVGRAGVYGQRAANFALQNSDYVLAIGTRLAVPQVGYELSELARAARIDMVDIDETEGAKLGGRLGTFICADAGEFVRDLREAAGGGVGDKSTWRERCAGLRRDFPWVGSEHADRAGYMNSYRFMERLNGVLKPDQTIVTDMGTALLCGHQVLGLGDGQRLMTSTGLGEMGYGLPGAIGASFAMARGEVMCLNCDGGMMMNLQELQTVVHHRLPIKLFVFNNDGYLMIKHTQNALFKSGYVGTDARSGVSCPDFSKLAAAFGMPAFQIRTWDECDDVLAKVQAADGPVICEVFMHPEQVFSPKLSLVAKPSGELVSPPLEDLSPLVSMETLKRAMLVELHTKSASLR